MLDWRDSTARLLQTCATHACRSRLVSKAGLGQREQVKGIVPIFIASLSYSSVFSRSASVRFVRSRMLPTVRFPWFWPSCNFIRSGAVSILLYHLPTPLTHWMSGTRPLRAQYLLLASNMCACSCTSFRQVPGRGRSDSSVLAPY